MDYRKAAGAADHHLVDEGSVAEEWRHIVSRERLPARVQAVIAGIVSQQAVSLAARFYHVMMADPKAAVFLSHNLVESRLGLALSHWLTRLFAADRPDSIAAALADQRRVGQAHARIQVPVQLVGRGMRSLKHWLWEFITEAGTLDPAELRQAVIYVNDLLDLAFEAMTAAFISQSDRVARADEGYRLFSLSQDLAIDRERQRAALVEWNHQIMNFAYRRPGPQAPMIGHSEFGLWLLHKALFMFEQSPEVHQIQAVVQRIDSELVAELSGAPAPDDLARLFTQLDREIAEIKYLLNALFERHLELENGRDSLTKLLNRRFLPSIMMREIDLAKKKQQSFAVLLIDIDHFKQVNDAHGHDAGDAALQQVAGLLLGAIRSGDFVFRYGGEEMLVILVDLTPAAALAVAEKIREKVAQSKITLSGGRSLEVTISIGVAAYDGHPDYRLMITRADSAVYAAKNGGRNRVVMAE